MDSLPLELKCKITQYLDWSDFVQLSSMQAGWCLPSITKLAIHDPSDAFYITLFNTIKLVTQLEIPEFFSAPWTPLLKQSISGVKSLQLILSPNMTLQTEFLESIASTLTELSLISVGAASIPTLPILPNVTKLQVINFKIEPLLETVETQLPNLKNIELEVMEKTLNTSNVLNLAQKHTRYQWLWSFSEISQDLIDFIRTVRELSEEPITNLKILCNFYVLVSNEWFARTNEEIRLINTLMPCINKLNITSTFSILDMKDAVIKALPTAKYLEHLELVVCMTKRNAYVFNVLCPSVTTLVTKYNVHNGDSWAKQMWHHNFPKLKYFNLMTQVFPETKPNQLTDFLRGFTIIEQGQNGFYFTFKLA